MTIAHATTSTLAVGTTGAGMTVALFTAGEIGTVVGVILAAVMTVLTFRANAAAAAAREAVVTARETRIETIAAQKAAAELAAAHAIALEKIRTSVDGAATASVARIIALEEKIVGLVAQLAEKRQDAAVAGARSASELRTPPADSLKKIDKNTAETASNTARTDASVQDLKDQKP